MLMAAGGGALAGALIGSGVAFFGGAAAATALAEGAFGAVVNAGISVGVDDAVTKLTTGHHATMGHLAITATASFATAGISSGVNSMIDDVVGGSIEGLTKGAFAKLGAAALYTPLINTAQRHYQGYSTTVSDLTLDVVGGLVNRTILESFEGELHNVKLNAIANAAQFPYTTLNTLKKHFRPNGKDFDPVIIH
jgi:hypothetical protein